MLSKVPSKFQPYVVRTDMLPEHLRPLGDRVLIRHFSHQEKIGSLFIPEIAQEQATYTKNQGFLFRGVVVAVGDGATYVDRQKRGQWVKRRTSVLLKPDVKPGDVVLFERRREAEIDWNGEVYTLCHCEQSIMAVAE